MSNIMPYSKQRQQLIIETKQDTDIFQSTSLHENMIIRLLSVRSLEAQLDSLPNQDYAAVAYSQDGSSLSFCVCDGVGSSYKGDFAASYLTTQLLGWLQSLPDVTGDISRLTMILETRLDSWAQRGQHILQRFPLPSEASILMQEVLTEHREIHGSETVFFGGRVDYAKGFSSRPASAIFCWMGNVTAQLFVTAGTYTVLGDHGNDSHRWSTARGRRGRLAMLRLPLNVNGRMIIYTDGLDGIAKELGDLDDRALQARMHQLLQLPTNDDMTILALQWQDPHLREGAME